MFLAFFLVSLFSSEITLSSSINRPITSLVKGNTHVLHNGYGVIWLVKLMCTAEDNCGHGHENFSRR